jgi:PAS domain S-box-containing protein
VGSGPGRVTTTNRTGSVRHFEPVATGRRGTFIFACQLVGIALAYFALAKLGLAVASINPSASPIWPPSGFALAAVLLWGARIWPAVFVAALAVNVLTTGSVGTSLAIALGNTLECLVTGFLLNRLSGGAATFDTPTGVVRFAALSLAPGPLIAATLGVGSLALAGHADWANFAPIWLTWWLGDAASAVVIAPAIVLCARSETGPLTRAELSEAAGVLVIAIVIGTMAFSPLLQQTAASHAMSFLVILPLMLAALRRGTRDTALVALALSCFAVWGTLMNSGPFAGGPLNDSFLLLLAFIISITVPSLALAADVAVRTRVEEDLRNAHGQLDQQVRQRTAELANAIESLQSEVEERREIDAKLEEQRVHLLEAQRLANLGSWSWDVASGRVNWSQQTYEIYGVKPGGSGGTYQDYLDRVHPDDRERVRATITGALASGGPFRMDERIVRPNGEIRHLQSSGEVIKNERGEPVQMLGICQDVTDRRSVEHALRESEERYRLLVESVRDYAIYMLDPKGHIASWNSGAARIKQYAQNEVLGRHFGMFYTEEERAAGQPERSLRLAAGGKYEAEGWRVRKDGTRFWASIVIDPILAADGTLLGFAKVTRDVTERHEAQAALDEARDKLAQAQKMEALGQLTGGIAHDFNNLLMIVSGHAQLLRRRTSEERNLRAIDAIAAATSRGESLTRQLLGFSRRQPLSPVVVDLKERIEAVRDMLGSSLRGNIELVLDLPDGLWRSELDLNEFDLALVNIAVNARDAMPEGGRFTLSASNVTLAADRSTVDLDGEFVALSLTDTGTGIPSAAMPKVFEPFFTTKAVGKGTGLGLSQVYGFAHQAGGTVTIESKVGLGTTVTIYLPRSRAAVSDIADAARTPPAVRGGSGTILVVEDNAEVADVTSTLLGQLGYRVLRAQNAADALAVLNDGGIDLVFTDIIMPGPMDGLALAAEIRARYPQIPVVLTTGYTVVAPDAEYRFAVLRKPFQIPALEKILREAMQRSRRRDGAQAAR